MEDQPVSKLRSTWLLLTLAMGISLVVASPVSADHSQFIPAADNPCGVDILLEVEHRPSDSGRAGYGDYTFTNLETGATYVQRSRGLPTETFDATTESWHITINGRVWTTLYPGEPGPSGVVQEPGLWILTNGTVEYTLDQSGALTAFSLDGTYSDLCAELSG